jgi:Cd2+/Zn2+-exporting ATPase
LKINLKVILILASHFYEQLGHALEIVHAELLPEDKARIVREFKREGPTAMTGDGVNDAPALATADIGISMGISGSALATETGQVILMSNDIRKIPEAIQLARKAHRKVMVNIFFSITTKSAILALAFAGHPLVWAAVLADVGTCLLVILNSMLLLQGTEKPKGKSSKSSAAQHTHKHGCNASNGHSSHHHHQQDTRHHCCSDKKDQMVTLPQKFSSKMCAANVTSGEFHEAKHCTEDKCHSSHHHHHHHHQQDTRHHCCSDKKDQMVTLPQKFSSKMCSANVTSGEFHEAKHCTEDKCTNSIGRKGDCAEDDGLQEEKHCKHLIPMEGMQSTTNDDHCHSDHCGKSHSHCKHLIPLEGMQTMTNDGHCHSDHCGKSHSHPDNGATGKMVSSCNHQLNAPLQTTIDIVPCTDHVESITIHDFEKREIGGSCKNHRTECAESAAAMHSVSLENREIGGCCKSYMKECCGKHGHLGTAFGGGLSEIITE